MAATPAAMGWLADRMSLVTNANATASIPSLCLLSVGSQCRRLRGHRCLFIPRQPRRGIDAALTRNADRGYRLTPLSEENFAQHDLPNMICQDMLDEHVW